MFVSKVSGPFTQRKEAEQSMRVFIRVQKAQDETRKQAFEAANPGREFMPFSPPAEDIYRIENNKNGFIVVLDDPSL